MSAQSTLRWVLVLLALLVFCPLLPAQRNRPGQPARPGQPGQPIRPPNQPQPFPQNPSQPLPEPDATPCFACFGTLAVIVIGGVSLILYTIAMIFACIWVAKDAKARGVESPAMWVLLTIFLGLIGLIIYIVSRPPGTLKECRECHKKRLRDLKRCPHCGIT